MARPNPDALDFLERRNPDQLYREAVDPPPPVKRRGGLLATIFALAVVLAPVIVIWAAGMKISLVPPKPERLAVDVDRQRKENEQLRKDVNELRDKVRLLEFVIRSCPTTREYLEGGFYQSEEP